MAKLNKDGLTPGQNVDFATINRINRERKLKEVAANEKASKRKQQKVSDALSTADAQEA